MHKEILVFNINWVGDAIFSTAVFKALKKAYPQARVTCLAVPRIKEILESCPFVDRILIYDEKGEHKSIIKKIKLIFQLRRQNFDIAFLLHGSLTRAFIVFLAGIPARVGYGTKKRGFLLTKIVEPLNGLVHRADYYLRVVEAAGVTVEDRSYELFVDDNAQREIGQRLEKEGISHGDFLIVVNVGGNWGLKRWPKEDFACLIDWLIHEGHAKVIVPGGEKDKQLAFDIFERARFKPVIWAGKTNLNQLLALMKRADLVISADTGPLHLASSVQTTSIGLFGPTRPEVTGPRGKGKLSILYREIGCNHLPCYNLGCPDNICMKMITVDDVIHEVQRIRN